MSTTTILLALVVIMGGVIAGLVFYRSRPTARHTGAPPQAEAGPLAAGVSPASAPEAGVPPSLLAFGASPDGPPAVTIQPLQDEQQYRQASPLDAGPALLSRMGAAFQAAPSVLLAHAHHSKHIMEVVVNGDLVRSAAGDGFRAWTKGPKGIGEHATLKETGNLTDMANAAAVWQVASVIVAQKHLADIAEKLESIGKDVKDVSAFLDRERRSYIEAAYSYLGEVATAIGHGDLPVAARVQLETCEVNLRAAQFHLKSELQVKLQERITHSETFGSRDLSQKTLEKYDRLVSTVSDLRLALKTRVLALYVLSLYPGDQNLQQVRKASLEKELLEVNELESRVLEAMQADSERIKATFNLSSTLDERKRAITANADKLRARLASTVREVGEEIRHSDGLLLKHDKPTRLLVELSDGKVNEVRVLN